MVGRKRLAGSRQRLEPSQEGKAEGGARKTKKILVKKKKNDFSSDRTLLIFDPGDRAGKIFRVGYPGSAGETSELDYGILT